MVSTSITRAKLAPESGEELSKKYAVSPYKICIYSYVFYSKSIDSVVANGFTKDREDRFSRDSSTCLWSELSTDVWRGYGIIDHHLLARRQCNPHPSWKAIF